MPQEPMRAATDVLDRACQRQSGKIERSLIDEGEVVGRYDVVCVCSDLSGGRGARAVSRLV